ncbi:serine hydrolase domain-containing protein [Microvirga arsenatis]|uniref:Serine hydrolase n=1 Tax=Microvirga arsenatis TaxID=2692265 RepID=A0ABW9YSH2_9HYPH|nr:serine hydrolase [Microvirga arsenatis]NBJ10063.1 serine hydrolase [Microvirga arsenatis]NBJ23131.1 serine hydrolase [Microvirga arsenatis]
MRRGVILASVAIALTLLLSFLLLTSEPHAQFERAETVYPFVDVAHFNPDGNYLPVPRWRRLLSPDQIGWSPTKLDAVRAYAGSARTDALLVVHKGLVILDYGRYQSKFPLHSVRKSLMSVAYGTYYDDGTVDITKSLEELGIDDVGGLSKQERQAKIRDLLTSTSGVYHPAAYETKGMRERRPARDSHKPGEHWFYNNWDFNALATILKRLTSDDFFEAFEQRIAIPIGMEHFSTEDGRYYYERDKSEHPAYLFRMSALDLARVGLLYLRNGEFGGQRIVSKEWVDRSTSVQHAWRQEQPTAGYGYMWKVTKDGFYAAGRGGQRLYVIPKRDLVIVHLVNTDGGKRVKNSSVRNLYRMILDAHRTPATGEPDEQEEDDDASD